MAAEDKKQRVYTESEWLHGTKQRPPNPGIVVDGSIVRAIDGDTFELEFVRRVRVRLVDCWAAESRTSNAAEKRVGLEAKEFAKRYEGSECRLVVRTDGDDDLGDGLTFGRVLGDVFVNGESVAAAIVSAGHAFKTKPELEGNLENLAPVSRPGEGEPVR